MPNDAAIGVFDSGVGGLTVAAAIRERLPNEALLYLGDTARVPYGTKSPDIVRRYAINCGRFLTDQGAKILVIACNTASAYAIEALRRELDTPVVGVVEPGARLAAEATSNGKIGVIGTEGTIASGSYQRALQRFAPDATVHTAACPLFVPFAEEGMVDHLATRLVAEEYLRPLVDQGIDTIVLGCTHYPLLRPLIAEIVGTAVRVIDSATAVAEAVGATLADHDLVTSARSGPDRFFATDVSSRVERVGAAFLGAGLGQVTRVDL
ncbi:MAG: glutamate racemase [Myxococcota bacterium]